MIAAVVGIKSLNLALFSGDLDDMMECVATEATISFIG